MRAHGIPLRGLDGAVTRVLLIDSDYEPADMLRLTLERDFEYEIQVATGVFEAGLLARQFRPHVIFLNLVMPGLNPPAMLKALRSDPELVASRVIAVDSALTDERVKQHLQGGFDACLAKPYHLHTVVRVIEEATDIVS
jgi:CheY-like chemotaxis protein